MSLKKLLLSLIILSGILIVGFMMDGALNPKGAEEDVALEELLSMKREAQMSYEIDKNKVAIAEREEEARKQAEALALKEAEEKRLEDIRENTYFAKIDTFIYTEPSVDAKTSHKVEAKTSVYVTNTHVDPGNQVRFFEVKTGVDATEKIGYVLAAQVVKNRFDFITNPISDVDYTAYERRRLEKMDIDVKAIFVTGHTASNARMDELIQLIDETELNAVVIDVKDDSGYMLYPSSAAEAFNPEANNHAYLTDVKPLIDKLKEHDIYVIARIVTFKSPLYASAFPERAISYRDSGKLYSDGDRLLWASPHDRTLWDFNVSVAEEAAALGFDEIQFDYVRFPAIYRTEAMDYKNPTGESRTAAIQNFLKYANERLKDTEVVISGDVFGWAASATDDVGIGQHWEAVSNVVDVVCPMMYPSHYGPGNFGLTVPDAFPYETIDRSIKAALNRNANLETPGKLRPWIQDFTATWVDGHIRYGSKEVRAQIDALKANGIDEYLVWNAGNYYSKDAFK